MSVAFGIDVFARRTVGWRVSRSARADCAPGASGQALRQRQPFARGALAHHSDGGSRCVSTRRAERLAEAGLEPSVGSVGGSCDKALAGTVIGLVKAEVIHRRGPSLVRGRRVRHPRTGRLVPQPPPDRADRQYPARRSGGSLLCLAQGQADRPLKLKPNSLQENQGRFINQTSAALDTPPNSDRKATALGTLNTVSERSRQLYGDATDGEAMCSAIKEASQQTSGCSALVLGQAIQFCRSGLGVSGGVTT